MKPWRTAARQHDIERHLSSSETIMPRALRNTLAVVGGTAVAMFLVTVGDRVLRLIWPMPSGYGDGGREALIAALQTLPATAFLFAVTCWSLATAAGAFAATQLSAGRRQGAGLLIAAVMTLASLANLAMIWHPLWLWPATLILVPGAGWLGARAAAAPATAESDVATDPAVHA
jgi:hypothetical protein